MSGHFTEIDGGLRYIEDKTRYRFLFDDGSTVDVDAAHDSSDMRGALLKHLGKERIEGVAELPAQGVLA